MPKRVPPLTAKTLASVRPGNKTIELVDGYLPGLRVRIFQRGNRSWSLNIRDTRGVRRRFDLGADLSLSEARRKAEALRQAVRGGADPTEERRVARHRAKAARVGHGTLRALLDAYYEKGTGAQLRQPLAAKKVLLTVFAKALNRPALDLSGSELQLLADDWRSQSTASLAIRLVRPCLKWGEKRKLVPVGTAAALEQPQPVRRRERVLSPDELKAVWPHLSGAHGNVMKWLLWTGCRLNEAAGMPWSEIAGSNWTIPGARSKSGRQRIIPLPTQATALLKECCRGEAGDLVFPSQRGCRLSNWDRVTKGLHAASGTSGWHRHDLRRTVATMLGDLGILPHVISAVLGHANIADGATALYARSRYQREHQHALQVLADEIDRLITTDHMVVRLMAS